MSPFEQFRQHWRATFHEGKVAENTLAFSLQSVSTILHCWFPQDVWDAAPLSDKFIYVGASIYTQMAWFLVLLGATTMEFNAENATEILRRVSVGVGGHLTMSRVFNGYHKRRQWTELVRDVNEAVRDARGYILPDMLEEYRVMYGLCLKMCSGASFILALYVLFMFLYSLVLGQHYLVIWSPAEYPAYSWQWFVELAISWGGTLFSSFVYATHDCTALDTMLQMAFCYRSVFSRLGELGTLGAEGDRRLLGWSTEKLVHLKDLKERFCDVVWIPYVLLWTLAYIILGLALLALTIEMDQGIAGLVNNVMYPLYFLTTLILSAAVGDYYEREANKLNDTLYNSHWQNMGVPNRRMMVTMMIVGQEQSVLDVPPLAVVNLATLGNVLRRTYSLYAIAKTAFG